MPRTVFRDGVVFDGSTAGPADVAIDNGLVVDVGPGLDGDEAVDCRGRSVLPGLFDCHPNTTVGDLDFVSAGRRPFSYHFYEAVRNFGLLLDLGITSVRDCGGADLGMKQAIEHGLIEGPRLSIAIAQISQTGGQGDRWLPSGELLPVPARAPHPGRPYGVADGCDAVRRTAREILRAGADVLSVAASGGVLSSAHPGHGQFRADELEVVVAEATAAGTYVLAHAQGSAGIKAAVRAGVRSIEHGHYLDDEAIESMVERGVWLVPMLSAAQGILDAAAAGIPLGEAAVRKIREADAAHKESFRRAAAAGVRIAMGSDAPVTPYPRILGELALMAEVAGLPAVDVWRTATSSAAELLGVGDRLGRLEPGKVADVVVLDGSLENLDDLGPRVEQVWKDGTRVR